MFNAKKAKEVEQLIIEHVSKVQEVLLEAHKMTLDYLIADKVFKKESYKVHSLEQQADELRMTIGRKLFEGAFLAVYRTDYFDIVDRLDRIANHSELFCDFLYLTRPMVPAFMVDPIKEIIEQNVQIIDALVDFVKLFIDGSQDFYEKKHEIQIFEENVDKIQFNVTRTIFKSDLKKIDKFHLKNVIDKLSRISDLVEDVTDRIEVLAAKLRM